VESQDFGEKFIRRERSSPGCFAKMSIGSVFLADGLLLVRRIREAESNRRPNVFQQACLLLIETSASISEIAKACGFDDEFYFSRCFRRQFGSPPRTYRKEHLIRSGRAV
jgi:hypothetical protein